uniref:Prospero domain-containing protein n=1 Tax=Globodera pallida TaxID=36090 RepID=A0A183BPK8_GLOPA
MSSSLGNEHNNALNDDKLTYNNGLHTFDQQQQQQNRRSENRDDVDGGGEPDDHGDEDRMEQIEDEFARAGVNSFPTTKFLKRTCSFPLRSSVGLGQRKLLENVVIHPFRPRQLPTHIHLLIVVKMMNVSGKAVRTLFIKRLDEGEEEADDEQMGPTDLFMDSNHSGVSTSPLNAFAYFPPPLFPLEADEEESGGQHHKEDATLQKQQPNLGYFARFLKNELAGACAGAVDKVVGDFSTSSSSSCSNGSSADNVDEQYTQQQHQTAVQHQQHLQAVHATRLWTAALALAATRQQQQHLTTEQQALAAAQIGACRTQMPPFSLSSTTTTMPPTSRGMPTTPASAFPWFSVPSMSMNAAAAAALYTTAQQHPLISTAIGAFLANAVQSATSSASVRGGGGGGIFPPPPVPHPSSHNYPLRLGLRSSADCDDSPRKKRAKVTDCVRGPRSSLHREFAAFPANSPRTTPANAAATVPTMVPSVEPHARLLAFRCTGKSSIGGGAGGIPEVSSGDELAVPISPHRTTLTHMHLRKAKLMFFYQRYPSSSLLKSYFPDVHFTKHNTAQVLGFS